MYGISLPALPCVIRAFLSFGDSTPFLVFRTVQCFFYSCFARGLRAVSSILRWVTAFFKHSVSAAESQLISLDQDMVGA